MLDNVIYSMPFALVGQILWLFAAAMVYFFILDKKQDLSARKKLIITFVPTLSIPIIFPILPVIYLINK